LVSGLGNAIRNEVSIECATTNLLFYDLRIAELIWAGMLESILKLRESLPLMISLLLVWEVKEI